MKLPHVVSWKHMHKKDILVVSVFIYLFFIFWEGAKGVVSVSQLGHAKK